MCSSATNPQPTSPTLTFAMAAPLVPGRAGPPCRAGLKPAPTERRNPPPYLGKAYVTPFHFAPTRPPRYCWSRIPLERPRVSASPAIRLGVDIGGTFTDVALEIADRRFTAKTLTTTAAPEEGVLAALGSVISDAGIT